jgi:hypothetical protein
VVAVRFGGLGGAMKTYLGVDVGTTGVKASIFDVRGNLKSQSFVPSKLYYPEFDPIYFERGRAAYGGSIPVKSAWT